MDELITIPEKPMSTAEIKLRYRSLVGTTPFECRKGWFPLIRGVLQSVEDALLAAGKQPLEFPKFEAIREKYGMLRMRIELPPDVPLIEHILSDAQDLSMETCIFCGGRGVMRATEWEHPACDPCEKRYILGEFR